MAEAERISETDLAAARSALPRVLPMPLKRAGNLLVGLCPIHREKTPSFTVYPDDWHYFCFGCGARGDAIDWLRRTKNLKFDEAVSELLSSSVSRTQWNGEHCSSPRKPFDPKRIEKIIGDLWRGATSPGVAEFYMQSRGIALKSLPEALRGHPRVWCRESGEYRPAMLAAISGSEGAITAIQRTWTETTLVFDGHTQHDKGARAVDLSAPKKTLGAMGNGAVRLAAVGETVGLAEGVEDSLAVAKLYRIPCWAVCGKERLGKIALPECVGNVVIFGDPDEPGRAAAAKAEVAYRRRGYNVQSVFPEGRDWAEMLP